MADDIAIRIEHVSKDFVLPHEKVNSVKSLFTTLTRSRLRRGKDTQHALHDISFEVKKGEFFGIVGRNGSGKSTLLKILAGIYQPTAGKTYTQGKLVPFIELGVGFNPELTGRENVYLNGAVLGFSEKEIDAMYDSIVEFAELEKFMDQKLKNYSSGMQVRLAFSMATRTQADILLIDEVLAVGDADFQRKCYDYFLSLKRHNKTVVFVSHDMAAIREYCDRAILIEKSQLVLSGDAETVSGKYTRMFLEPQAVTESGEPEARQRWGDKTAEYLNVAVSQVTKHDREVVRVIAKARINDLDKTPIFGFSVRNAGGTSLLGTNTKIKGYNVPTFHKGQTLEVVWEFDNVLNDGTYYIEPSIIYDNGNRVADWWEEAATFKVLKAEKVPYAINPDIQVDVQL